MYIIQYVEFENQIVDIAYEVILVIYYLPYSTNFFIYATSSQYRKAYIYFFKKFLVNEKMDKEEICACQTNTETNLNTFREIEGIETYFD